jgi:hypothetical protein
MTVFVYRSNWCRDVSDFLHVCIRNMMFIIHLHLLEVKLSQYEGSTSRQPLLNLYQFYWLLHVSVLGKIYHKTIKMR